MLLYKKKWIQYKGHHPVLLTDFMMLLFTTDYLKSVAQEITLKTRLQAVRGGGGICNFAEGSLIFF